MMVNFQLCFACKSNDVMLFMPLPLLVLTVWIDTVCIFTRFVEMNYQRVLHSLPKVFQGWSALTLKCVLHIILLDLRQNQLK